MAQETDVGEQELRTDAKKKNKRIMYMSSGKKKYVESKEMRDETKLRAKQHRIDEDRLLAQNEIDDLITTFNPPNN